MARFLRKVSAVLVALAAAGCASAPDPTGQNDPYEAQNRKVFELNQKLDESVALPVATFYVHAVPHPVRDGIHNFLVNLDVPVTLANDVLQGEAERAVDSAGRFVINSTIGVGGLIDVAAKVGVPEHTADFGETLAVYGVGEGPYLVLPFFGPSNPRDAVGLAVDNTVLDPWFWITWRSSFYYKLGDQVLDVVDKRAQNINTIKELERSSVDLYATERSLYRQHREAEINHGKADIGNLPNF
ncbi:MAG TPA: VacJ family lipoprotein [Rhizomicrobium sp.]|jgi:phospholipid-binding lipoprotein MlaA|nr:VacJ family lipoprotein [Rhizomicrobium sp.]